MDVDVEDEERKKDRASTVPLTEADLQREEEQIKELEIRKRTLEERVDGMQKDLGGILR